MDLILLSALGVGGATIFGSIAGGTMLYVLSDETIPKTHAHGA